MTYQPQRFSAPDGTEMVVLTAADYERLAHQVDGSLDALTEHLFSAKPHGECLVAVENGLVVGYALFFTNFSTFLTKPGMWLEDLYVTPSLRGKGLGKRLLTEVAYITVERDCARLDWVVADWNSGAIAFYESLGAERILHWQTCRIDGRALLALGAASPFAELAS